MAGGEPLVCGLCAEVQRSTDLGPGPSLGQGLVDRGPLEGRCEPAEGDDGSESVRRSVGRRRRREVHDINLC